MPNKKSSSYWSNKIWKIKKWETEDILRDNNRNKKLYEHIRQLKGEDKKQKKILIYDEAGEKLEGQDLKNCLKDKWQNINAE